MNTNPIIHEPTMSSVEIAEATGKQHKDVLKAIRNMEPAWEKVRGRKFALTTREVKMPKGAKREEPMYILTKTECLYIATKFNDEARALLVLRWQQLEIEKLQQSRISDTTLSYVPVLSRRQILLYALQAEDEAEFLRETATDLLAQRYNLIAENARLRRTIDYLINNR